MQGCTIGSILNEQVCASGVLLVRSRRPNSNPNFAEKPKLQARGNPLRHRDRLAGAILAKDLDRSQFEQREPMNEVFRLDAVQRHVFAEHIALKFAGVEQDLGPERVHPWHVLVPFAGQFRFENRAQHGVFPNPGIKGIDQLDDGGGSDCGGRHRGGRHRLSRVKWEYEDEDFFFESIILSNVHF